MKKNHFLKYGIIICILLLNLVFGSSYAQVSIGDPLPEGYNFKNIGEPRGPTIYSYNDTTKTYYIDHQGGGDTGWGTEDVCSMIYFETAEDKEIVARLVSLSVYGNTFNPKGFIMVRSSLDPEAAMCYLELRNDGHVILDWRPEPGLNNTSASYNQNFTLPFAVNLTWLKFVREGSYISGFYSKDGNQWTPVGPPIKLKFSGSVFMGIGAAGALGGARVTFDNFEVRDKRLPYFVDNSIIQDQTMNYNQISTLDITKVFGHYAGDYFTVNAVSTDTSVLKVRTFLAPNPAYATEGGDQFLQKLELKSIKYGLANVKLTSNVVGYKMSYQFLTEVNGPHSTPVITSKNPSPWIMKDLGTASSPSLLDFQNSVNEKLSVYRSMKSGTGSDSLTAVYKYFGKSDNLRLITRIDSVNNSGKDAFAGLFLRDSTVAGSPFVSFTLGAYEGIRFSYRWASKVNVTKIEDSGITYPCWLMLDYYTDQGNTFFQPYYSYDGLYWKSLLKYPFPLSFSNNRIMAGFMSAGGNKTSTDRKSVVFASNFNIIKNSSDSVYLLKNKPNSELKMVPVPVTTSAKISYNVVIPGPVYLAVYDVYGILRDVLVNGNQEIGSYSLDYDPSKLGKKGIYLLKLATKGDYKTIKFIYE